jgi:soluble lytic murein transglycosylase
VRQLAEGFESLEARRLPQAVYDLSAARTGVPVLRDYASYFLAQAQYRSTRYGEAASAAEEVVDFQPLSPLAGRAAVLGARAWLELNQPRKALTLLARVAEDALPNPEASLVRARALEAAGAPLDAVAGFQAVYYLYPQSPDSREASEGLERLRSALGSKFPEASPELRFERAGRIREAGDLARARREYEAIASELGGQARELAAVRIASLAYFGGEGAAPLSRLESLGRQAGEIEAERLYYMVQCYRRLERDDEMAAALEALATAAPRSPWRLKALGAGSSRFLVKDDPRQSQAFAACADSFPDAPEAVMCHWHAAWWAYRRHQAETVQLMRRHIQLYPSSEKVGAAVFYLGRLAAKSGDGSAALAWFRFLVRRFPNYYYAFEARRELRALEARRIQPSREVDDFLASIPFPDRPAQADLTPDAGTARRIERARLLTRADLVSWAEAELRFASRNGAQPWPVVLELAEMATRDGSPDRALRQIKNVLPTYLFMPREGAPRRFWHLAFPLPYHALIVKYARQVGLDPYLVSALIRQESEFNPRALSPSKAVGLMQIMPPVGRELARSIPVRGYRASKLTSPEINIRLGTYYFRRLLDSCGGKVEDALAAYNAGRSRVTLWRGWGPFEDTNEFAETIPFAQTRDYVQIILRNAELYRWLYASERVSEEEAAIVDATPASGAATVSRKAAPVVTDAPERRARPAKRSTSKRRATRKTAPVEEETSEAPRKPAKRSTKASRKATASEDEASEQSKKPARKSAKATKKAVAAEDEAPAQSRKPAKRSTKATRKAAPSDDETSGKSGKTAKSSASRKSSKGSSTSSGKSSKEPKSKAPASKKKRSKRHEDQSS